MSVPVKQTIIGVRGNAVRKSLIAVPDFLSCYATKQSVGLGSSNPSVEIFTECPRRVRIPLQFSAVILFPRTDARGAGVTIWIRIQLLGINSNNGPDLFQSTGIATNGLNRRSQNRFLNWQRRLWMHLPVADRRRRQLIIGKLFTAC